MPSRNRLGFKPAAGPAISTAARTWLAGKPMPADLELMSLLGREGKREMWKCEFCQRVLDLGTASSTALKRHGRKCLAKAAQSKAGGPAVAPALPAAQASPATQAPTSASTATAINSNSSATDATAQADSRSSPAGSAIGEDEDTPSTSELQWFQPLRGSTSASCPAALVDVGPSQRAKLSPTLTAKASAKNPAGPSKSSSASGTRAMNSRAKGTFPFPVMVDDDAPMAELSTVADKTTFPAVTVPALPEVKLPQDLQSIIASPASSEQVNKVIFGVRSALASLNEQQARITEALRPLLDASVATAQQMSKLQAALAQLEAIAQKQQSSSAGTIEAGQRSGANGGSASQASASTT
ncbi:hypothetical protein OC835_005009 [Tilletia horrida]|nr:hypothetical protein OC835_005009 [Tilletia horrida]